MRAIRFILVKSAAREMPEQYIALCATGATMKSDQRVIAMKNTKLDANSLETFESTSCDVEVLEFWNERARIQLSCMNAIAAYIE